MRSDEEATPTVASLPRGFWEDEALPRGPEGVERRRAAEHALTCEVCGARWRAQLRTRIRVEKWPEARAALLARRLGAIACPGCRVPARFEEEFLYHDAERRMMLWVLPPREGADFPVRPDPPPDPALVAHLARLGYRFRVVHSIEALREKVEILEAGCDDRWFEYVRAAAERNARRAWGGAVALALEAIQPGWEVRFRLADSGRRTGAGYHLSWASYLALEAEGRREVGDLVTEYEPGVVVVDGSIGSFLHAAREKRNAA